MRRRRRRRLRPGLWRRTWLQLTAALAVVAVLGNGIAGLRLGPALGVAVVGGAALATLIQVGLAALVDDDEPATTVSGPTAPPDSYLRLRQNVRWATNEPPRLSEPLTRTIRELTADRLETRHGIHLAADSQRAQALVDPELWAVVTATEPPTGLDATALARITRRIEDL